MIGPVVEAIASLPKPAFCLDFDGTLVAFAERPELIHVGPELPALLSGLSGTTQGRLAIITGRSFADLSRHLDTRDILVASSHGAEISLPGATSATQLAEPQALDHHRQFIAELIADMDGVWLEDKQVALAVHTRANPSKQAPIHEQLQKMTGTKSDLVVMTGNAVIEVRHTARNKGVAVDMCMQLDQWKGAQPVMFGDDTTDDDGMAVAVHHGGLGIQVGQRAEGTPLPHATHHLADVQATLATLRALVRRGEGGDKRP